MENLQGVATMTPCHRCGGLVVDEYGDTHCLLCGWYYHPPDAPPIEETRGARISEGFAKARGKG